MTFDATTCEVIATEENSVVVATVDCTSVFSTIAESPVSATVEESNVYSSVEETVVHAAVVGVQGPQGRDGAGMVTYAFAYNSISTLPLKVAPAGKTCLRVEICITEAFNGVGASLSIGDAGNTSRLMTTAQIDPASAHTYSNTPGISYAVDTQTNLTITPGSGATAGAGVVSIVFEQ